MSYSDYWNQVYQPPSSNLGRGGNIFPNAPNFDGQSMAFGDFKQKSQLDKAQFMLGGGKVGDPPQTQGGNNITSMLGELFGGNIPAGIAQWAGTLGQFRPGQPRLMPGNLQDLVAAIRARFPRAAIPNMPNAPVRSNFPTPGLGGQATPRPVVKRNREEPIGMPTPNPRYRVMPEMGGASRFGFF